MISEKKDYDDIVRDLKTAIICLACVSAGEVIYYICNLFDIIKFPGDAIQNMGIYAAGCLGLAGDCWKQLSKLKNTK